MTKQISIKIVCFSLWLVIVLGGSSRIYSQSTPPAVHALTGQIGAGFSFATPDYGNVYLKGISAYGSVDLHNRIGLEADAHFDSLLTPTDIGENTFMVGPRFTVFRDTFGGRKDFMKLYVKALGGAAVFQYQHGIYSNPHSETYGAFGLGGGIDLRVAKHLSVRPVDVEYQRWPGWSPRGLTPIATTFGAAYVF